MPACSTDYTAGVLVALGTYPYESVAQLAERDCKVNGPLLLLPDISHSGISNVSDQISYKQCQTEN